VVAGNAATAIRASALCGVILLGVTACGWTSPSGPTAAQAGTRLSGDARALLSEMQKLLAAPAPYSVSADSADASIAADCSKGKQRRTFAASMQVPATPTAHAALILDGGSANGYLVQRGYSQDTDVTAANSDARRTEPMVDKAAGAHITVTLTPAADGRIDYVVTGTTDCLRTS
jgi:hypothetical protein